MGGMGRGLTIAIIVLAATGGSVYGGDALVPGLHGLARAPEAAPRSRLRPMLLAIDTTRPLPTGAPNAGGRWKLPVTDALEIDAAEGFHASLEAFKRRLDGAVRIRRDFVVQYSFTGTMSHDAELFAPSIRRVREQRIVLAWGTGRGVEEAPYYFHYDHQRGGSLGVPIFAVDRSKLDATVRDARLYVSLLAVKRVSRDLWHRVRAIPTPEIRYAAVRDVLNASYRSGYQPQPRTDGGLSDAPAAIRAAFAKQLHEAAGESPRRRLQALLFHRSDEAREVSAALSGEDPRWLVELMARDDALASEALGIVASRAGAAFARTVGADMVLAAIERPGGMPRHINTAVLILASTPPRRLSLARVRSVLRALVGDGPKAWSNHTTHGHATELLLALTRTFPDLVRRFPQLPEADRKAARAWLRAFHPWAPHLEDPIREARTLFDA